MRFSMSNTLNLNNDSHFKSIYPQQNTQINMSKTNVRFNQPMIDRISAAKKGCGGCGKRVV